MNELNSGLQLRINLPGRAPHTLGITCLTRLARKIWRSKRC
jgi:hypothetical protein